MGDPAKPPAGTSASQKGLVHSAFSPWSAIAEKEIPRMMYEACSVYRMVSDGTYPNDGERIKPVEAPYPEDDEKDNLCEDFKLTAGDKLIIRDKGEHPKDHPDYYKVKPDF